MVSNCREDLLQAVGDCLQQVVACHCMLVRLRLAVPDVTVRSWQEAVIRE